MKIAITGASGLIGSAIIEHLFSKGHTFHCLKRNLNTDGLIWNPDKIETLYENNETIDAVIHLAGENISTGRWWGSKKHKIRRSRIQGTHEIASYFSNAPRPPKTMIFASAIGYYGSRKNELLTETSSKGSGFLSDICHDWEEAATIAQESGIRTVLTRFGMVLSPQGGALHKMLPPFKAGFGGKIGDGKQYMSWISILDLTAAIDHILNDEQLTGPVNIVSDHPVTNHEFTNTLGRLLQRHTIFSLPSWIVKLAFGQMGKELLLSSSKVSPEKLLTSGFSFKHSNLKEALIHSIG